MPFNLQGRSLYEAPRRICEHDRNRYRDNYPQVAAGSADMHHRIDHHHVVEVQAVAEIMRQSNGSRVGRRNGSKRIAEPAEE